MSSNSGHSAEVTEGEVSPLEDDVKETLKFKITKEKEVSVSVEVETLKHDLPTIMVAGRPRSGKSTALNNTFDLNLAARASASSVTNVASITEVTKKIPREKNDLSSPLEVTVQVVDTPGLGSLDIPKEDILKEMKRIAQGIDFTLVYCFSVTRPSSLIYIVPSVEKYKENVCCCSLLVTMLGWSLRTHQLSMFITLAIMPKNFKCFSKMSVGTISVSRAYLTMSLSRCYLKTRSRRPLLVSLSKRKLHKVMIFYQA